MAEISPRKPFTSVANLVSFFSLNIQGGELWFSTADVCLTWYSWLLIYSLFVVLLEAMLTLDIS
jgi:hypothetical protein